MTVGVISAVANPAKQSCHLTAAAGSCLSVAAREPLLTSESHVVEDGGGAGQDLRDGLSLKLAESSTKGLLLASLGLEQPW